MDRRALVVVLLLVLAVLAFLGYRAFDAHHAVATLAHRDNAEAQDASNTTLAPALQRASATAQQPGAGQIAQPASQPSGTPADLPANGDTINPNPPNGMVFAASGRYQLYRQGNITWRLDSDTGHTCVIFATDEEWSKPRVYHNGCAKN